MRSPSFLAHQGQFEIRHGRPNCTSLFGIGKIPSDAHIRDMLDLASPTLPQPVFANTLDQLLRLDSGLALFRWLAGHVLIALDGTQYHGSRKFTVRNARPGCAAKARQRNFYTILAATQVAPGHDKVIPLEPEFIVP